MGTDAERDDNILFPRRLSYAVGIVFILVIISSYYTTLEMREHMKVLTSKQFPILENSAINVRLMETLQFRIHSLATRFDPALRDAFLVNRESLNQSLDESAILISGGVDRSLTHFQFEEMRSILSRLEDRIIAYAEKGDYEGARRQLESDEYLQAEHSFQNQVAQVTEDLAVERQGYLEEQDRFLKMSILVSLVSLSVLAVLMYFLMSSFRSNLENRKTAERILAEERSKALNNSKLASLGEMAGGIAHEINNPLAIIRGYAEILMASIESNAHPDRDLVGKMSEKILQTSDRISSIVQGLRRISRDASHDEYEVFPVADVVKDTLGLCKERFESSGIMLSVQYRVEGLYIKCRAVEISQVLLNLLNNAYDAVKSETEPWVNVEIDEVALEDGSPGVQLSIVDSGPGVPIHIRDKILNPFFTTKELGEGTGLGLSISNSIIKSHDGELVLDEAFHRTRFVIRLPKEKVAQPSMERFKEHVA